MGRWNLSWQQPTNFKKELYSEHTHTETHRGSKDGMAGFKHIAQQYVASFCPVASVIPHFDYISVCWLPSSIEASLDLRSSAPLERGTGIHLTQVRR